MRPHWYHQCGKNDKQVFMHRLLLSVIEVRETDFFTPVLGIILHACIFLFRHALTKGLIFLPSVSADTRLILVRANGFGVTLLWNPWVVSTAADTSTLNSTTDLGTGIRVQEITSLSRGLILTESVQICPDIANMK